MIAFPDFDTGAWLAIAFVFFSIFGRSLGWIFGKIRGGASSAAAKARMRERRETQLLDNEAAASPPQPRQTGVVQALERELGIVRDERPSVAQVGAPAVPPPPPSRKPPPPLQTKEPRLGGGLPSAKRTEKTMPALPGPLGTEELDEQQKEWTSIERSRYLGDLRDKVEARGTTDAAEATGLIPRGIAGWRRAFVLSQVLGTPVALRAPGAPSAPPGLS